MSSFLGKLRRLDARVLGAPELAVPSTAAPVLEDLRARMREVLARSVTKREPPRSDDTVDLPFAAEETDLGVRHRRVLHLGASHRVGRVPAHSARHADARLLSLLALDPSLASCDVERALYIDTETTGLSGGTGTVAFLVGLAHFAHGTLVVEQVLVKQLGEEAPMLDFVRQRIEEASMLVSFNGKSFDMPLLRTRFVMARMPPPKDLPHLDLLHVARRLHKPRGVECRLTNLEDRILGFERHDDCPSGEVSGRYLHFLRTGDARSLLGVVEHNAWDVVTMASLLGLYGEPLVGTQLEAVDLVGVARTLRRAKAHDEALDAANLAVEAGVGPESLRVRAEVQKARGDRDRALVDLESLLAELDCPSARLELVKLYEHHVKEPRRALDLLEGSLAEGEGATEKRRTRLERKVAKKVQGKLF